MNSASACTTRLVRVFAADGHPQTMRQAVIAERCAAIDPARMEERVGRFRIVRPVFPENE